MNHLVLDVETTFQKLPKGASSNSPFDNRNKLVATALYHHDKAECVKDPLLGNYVQTRIDQADVIVGFNFKFDYHWLRDAGIDLSKSRIWDCQLAEFLIRNQVGSYPSLDECLAKYGLPLKIDVVKEEYWNKGKNTDEVPWEILSTYTMGDVEKTYQLYLIQKEIMSPAKQRLLRLMCQDLHILAEMEGNGLMFNSTLCEERATEISIKTQAIEAELSSIYPDVPINFNSTHQLSAFLYGGSVKQEAKEQVGFFKGGIKAGQPKYKNIVIEHQLPRVYQPLRGTEMATEGVYSTDEGTLKKLKGKRRNVDLLLELAKLSKLNETYYIGLPALNTTMNWPADMLHGQFNQVTAVTGRLSSSRPNLQNFASELQDIFITRYP